MKVNKISILVISLSIILHVIFKFNGIDNLFMELWSGLNIVLILIKFDDVFKTNEHCLRIFKYLIIVLLILKIISIIEYVIL
ncbi:MAG: hypothetical protein RSC79_01970 [Anaerorhabdus sp.]